MCLQRGYKRKGSFPRPHTSFKRAWRLLGGAAVVNLPLNCLCRVLANFRMLTQHEDNNIILDFDIFHPFFFLDGRMLPMERRHQVLDNGTLIINKVIRKDGGMYACSATNRQGNSATQSGQLNVIGKPLNNQWPLWPWKQSWIIFRNVVHFLAVNF